jgi:hypothetical protein
LSKITTNFVPAGLFKTAMGLQPKSEEVLFQYAVFLDQVG